MVSTSKLLKAQTNTQKFYPYMNKMQEVMGTIFGGNANMKDTLKVIMVLLQQVTMGQNSLEKMAIM